MPENAKDSERLLTTSQRISGTPLMRVRRGRKMRNENNTRNQSGIILCGVELQLHNKCRCDAQGTDSVGCNHGKDQLKEAVDLEGLR